MKPDTPYQPIIIIGAARSGTKLLRDLIGLHPQVARVPYDVNFIWRYGNHHVPHDELSPGSVTPRIRNRITQRLGSFSHSRPFLAEKTVSNCVRVPFVRWVFPHAKFVHLLRDGADVVESVLRQWTAPPDWSYLWQKARSFSSADTFRYSISYLKNTWRRMTSAGAAGRNPGVWGVSYPDIHRDLQQFELLEVCAIQWKRCVEASLRDLREDPDAVLTLKYEDLVVRFQENLDKIGEFIGLGSMAYHEILPKELVTRSNVGKGRRCLSSGQIDMIKDHLNPLLIQLGYQPLGSNQGADLKSEVESSDEDPD